MHQHSYDRAKKGVEQGKGPQDTSGMSWQQKEAHDAGRAHALKEKQDKQ